jgi:hypothetical protein
VSNKRKEIWAKLPEEDKRKLEEGRKRLREWAVEENKRVWGKIVEEGRNKGGLDGDYPELNAITKEYNDRLYNMLKEYGLEWEREEKEEH